ncbi:MULTISPECIES: hypothetical protein [unclassified Streptomyces]|uniref:hypothetical protein n=1 Tax=unclassified Streptomyces TaxID=2593676 RepID=UPI000A4E639D|nr:hypothetical protein [Streptomyces sp. CB01883]
MTKGLAVLSTVLGSVLVVSGCSGGGGSVSRTSPGLGSEWDAKAGAPEVAAFMRIDVPKDATGVKGAVAVNPQEDNYLLSFVTGERTAERLAAGLHAPEPLRPQAVATAAGATNALFEHLGLTPPDRLRKVRRAGVCPPCVERDRGRVQWIEIYVHALGGGRARVYLLAY